MNIAFSALLILFVALPGIIAWYAYRSERGRPATTRPFTDEVPLGIIIAAGLHYLWVNVFNALGYKLGLAVDVDAALTLLSAQAGKDGEMFKRAEHALSNNIGWVALYFGSLCILAVFFGWGAKKAVLRWRLDRKLPLLQWSDWFYLLRGQSPLGMEDDGTKPDGVFLAAVSNGILYVGIIADWATNRVGELDVIVLEAASRRKIGEKEKPGKDAERDMTDAFYEIRADFVVLKYSEISNLAVTQFVLDQTDPAQPSPTPPSKS